MRTFFLYLRRLTRRNRHVRVWALSAPVIILLICLPLLRPLRHPDPRSVSDDELARLATIESLAERNTLAIDDSSFQPTSHTIQKQGSTYSDQPPVLAYILSYPYRVLYTLGLSLTDNPVLAPYLLTLLGITLPVAGSAGLLYKMARLFELRRHVRAMLALAIVLASGFVSYAVVLNAHAPAAVLLLCACACLVHVLIISNSIQSGAALIVAGLCAATAAVIDPPAVVIAVLLIPVIAAIRWRVPMRIGGIVLFLIGALPALLLHAELNTQVTGDVMPAYFDPAMSVSTILPTGSEIVFLDDIWVERSTFGDMIWINLLRVVSALFGGHGLFSHFPALIFAIAGIAMLMHRHWPTTTKVLASATLAGSMVIVLYFALGKADWSEAMFGARWFIVFLPLLMFWAGVWLRRQHRPITWGIAAVLLFYSITVSLIGATDPFPREGHRGYSAGSALKRLVSPGAIEPSQDLLAGGNGIR